MRCFSATLLALAALGALAAAPAEAAGGPAFLTQFGENCGVTIKILNGECGSAGETASPRGVATDPDTGHVLVADQTNNRIGEFTPWGEFVKAFGWDVAPGAVNEEQEVRIKAGAGQFRLSFEGESTSDMPFDASASQVESALNSLSEIGSDGSSVTEVRGNPTGTTPFIHVISFDGGALKATDVTQIEVEDGAIPLSGGQPTSAETRTRADGTSGGTDLEACTVASGCKAGLSGAGTGQINSPQGIAVDSSGDIYVVDFTNRRIEKFDSAGSFLLMIGGEVNKTKTEEVGSTEAQRNLCTAASGDVCQRGSLGAGAGEFEDWPLASSLIASGPGDVLYVGDKERIQKFNSDGSYDSQLALPLPINNGQVSSLAVAPGGAIYVTTANFQEPTPIEANVLELTAGGTVNCTIQVGKPIALAADPEGGVYVFADSVYEHPTESNTSEIRQYDSDCELIASFADHEFEASTGIGVNAAGNVYVSNRSTANSHIRAYGPAPVDFESPPPVAPQVSAQFATTVGTSSATVSAQINPKFWTDTTYYVEYGASPCSTGGCATQPLPPGAPLTGASISSPVTAAGIDLAGLAPGTVYHYRFVAQSGGGGPVYGIDPDGEGPGQASLTEGLERTFRTAVPVAQLPDGRVHELTSPVNKDGGEAGTPTAAGGGAEFSVQPQQASSSGDAVSYASFTAFENPESAPAASQYLSRPLGQGSWLTENLGPRFEEGFTRDPVVGLSESLAHAALIVIEPPLTPDATVGYPNLYVRNNVSGALTAITTKDHTPEIAVPKNEYCLYYGGASSDFKRVFFGAKGALIPGDSIEDGFNLYEWSAAQGLRLVSALPDGSAATPANNTGFGGLGLQLAQCNPSVSLMRHAISADGSRVFWTYPGSFSGGNTPLFARLNGAETIQLDARQGLSGKGGGGKYQDASLDGSKVFFTDSLKLTIQPTKADSTDLYRYDFDAPEGARLENLTAHTAEAADVAGVIGASADGSYVYFVADGVLDAGATSGANNLYVWHEGEPIRFLSTLADGDSGAWVSEPSNQTARVSPDGNGLAFLSIKSLTGFDNTVTGAPGCEVEEGGQLYGDPACAQAFLYDYSTDALTCASCNPSGARPHGPASLPTWSTPYQQPRYLSDDGNRVFFETLDALNPTDTNGKRDVYEFERAGTGSCDSSSGGFVAESNACIYLISSGKSSDHNYFLDASASGNDVFFSTRESLVFTDLDDRYDVYDARVGGTVPDKPQPPCESEDCRGPSTQPPAPAPAGTPAFVGPPNPKPARGCPKGTHKVKKKGTHKGKKKGANRAKKKGKARCVKTKKSGKHKRQKNKKGRAGR